MELPDPTALITTEELTGRLPFEMDADETREAEGALEDLSDDARFYGKVQWATPATTPRQVKNLVLRAAARHMKNYDGFTQSRAGDESLSWTDRGEDAGSAYFTEREIKILRQMSGNQRNGFHSVAVTAWGNSPRVDASNLVRDEDGFPLPLYIPDVIL